MVKTSTFSHCILAGAAAHKDYVVAMQLLGATAPMPKLFVSVI